jgi:hypothetical protein
MTQALYAHMNEKKFKKKKEGVLLERNLLSSLDFKDSYYVL